MKETMWINYRKYAKNLIKSYINNNKHESNIKTRLSYRVEASKEKEWEMFNNTWIL